MAILVILPTYNELESLPPLLEKLLELPFAFDILVVDDGSPDSTGAWVAAYGRDEPRVKLLQRSKKSGLKDAYMAGFAWASREGYVVVVEMDADGSHRPEELASLLAPILDGSADATIGTRWMPGGSAPKWALHRRLLSVGGSRYARTVLRVPLRDLTSGFRAFSPAGLAFLLAYPPQTTGYGFQIEVATALAKAPMPVVEVPITFVERTLGVSKMHPLIAVEALLLVTKWALTGRFRRSPLQS